MAQKDSVIKRMGKLLKKLWEYILDRGNTVLEQPAPTDEEFVWIMGIIIVVYLFVKFIKLFFYVLVEYAKYDIMRGDVMLGEYSIMDWVTLGGIVTTAGGVLALLVKTVRDYQALSKEHDRLLEKLSAENQSIKSDTVYISDEMKLEKMARVDLYKNSSRAKEILETMDMMKEVVLQNAQLNAEIRDLKIKNQELINSQENEQYSLLSIIGKISNQLAAIEEYGEAEEIRSMLRTIQRELSEASVQAKED